VPQHNPPLTGPQHGEMGELVALAQQQRWPQAEHTARALLNTQPNAGLAWKILSVALVRQGKGALPALHRTAELMPEDAEAHSNLGATLRGLGRRQEALASFRRALQIRPDAASDLIQAADTLGELGQAAEAVALYQRALEADPRHPEAQNNLGNALFTLGRYEDAVTCYRRALQSKTADAKIHSNLANALRCSGRPEEAVVSSRRAIALDPTLSEAYNNLGLALGELGQFEPALESFRQALRLNANYVDALNNAGNVLRDLGELREAVSLYARAIELDPQDADSHCNLGNVLFEFRRIDEAAASYRRALALKPDHGAAHLSLSMALRMLGRPSEAEASCQAALAIEPNDVDAMTLLGELFADRGQFSEAQNLFQQALCIDPGFSPVFFSIAMHRKMTSADAVWLQGADALIAKRLPLRHEISVRYARGKYFDDLKQYDRAFDNYRRANELTKRNGLVYDEARLTRRVDQIIDNFDAASLLQLQPYGHPSECPVLIVGMPRSGTSLTEQILASHPDVFGAGELSFWDNAFNAYESAGLKVHAGDAPAGATLIPSQALAYLETLSQLSGGAARVVDKMPPNFMNLGLIHAAFPRARIIHMRRHPIDTCLSIYFQYFLNTHPYANDLGSLAHYYGEYLRLMDHWRATIPAANLLEMPYEALIGDQEAWIRRVVEFAGLPWNPQCLDFHETNRVVITASKWQVRQKIHSASAGRWRNYQQFLQPLEPLLRGNDSAPAS
jgi:tetratricopeptide (TPR) repeat protein